MSGTVGDNTARASGVIASAGGGTILSAKSMKLESTTSRTGTAPAHISAFDMSFAATKSDSKLYFQVCIGEIGVSTDVCNTAFYFYDVTNSAIVGAYGDAAGSRLRVSWGTNIDHYHRQTNSNFGTWHEPGTTSSIDYTIYGAATGSQTMYINRSGWDADTSSIEDYRGASTFTITEYAADTVTLT